MASTAAMAEPINPTYFPAGEEDPLVNDLRGVFTKHLSDANITGAPTALATLELFPQDGKLRKTAQLRPVSSSNHHAALKDLFINILENLQKHGPARRLPATSGRKTFKDDIEGLLFLISIDVDLDFNAIKPLMQTFLCDKPDHCLIWNQAIDTVHVMNNRCPLPNDLYKNIFGPLSVGLRDLHKKFFGDVKDLEAAAKTVFEMCGEGSNPLFRSSQGWSDWPAGAEEEALREWFRVTVEKLQALADLHTNIGAVENKFFVQPNTPMRGDMEKRSVDICFAEYHTGFGDDNYRYYDVLVPGEIKKSPGADVLSIAWVDLARYAKKLFSTLWTRRYILGFTLCGSLMRVWLFDRGGSIASEAFDINENGLRFVTTVLGFLCMDGEELGLDPTIKVAGR
jgi:hypothetical protein